MTIDERADEAALNFVQEQSVNFATDSQKYRALVREFVSLARDIACDQRHACAEAVIRVDNNAWSKDAAHQAVMNANLQ